jgi:hypothetical protein
MNSLIIDTDSDHANGMRTRFVNRYATWNVHIAMIGSGSPSGNIVTYQSTVALAVQYAIDNGYKQVLYAHGGVEDFINDWKYAFANGVQPIVADGSNTHELLSSPPYLYVACEISGGLTTCLRSFGFIECFDASTTNETEESWACPSYAARFAKAIDDFSSDNLFDTRQRLRQASSFYATGWIADGGYGRVADAQAGTLELAPPLEAVAIKSVDSKSVALSWANFQQTRWNKTRIVRADTGATVYEGTGTSATFYSNVTGNLTFKFYSVDAQGNLSKDESYSQIEITGLEVYQLETPEIAVSQTNGVASITFDAVALAEQYHLQKNEGGGWVDVGDYDSSPIDVALTANTVTEFRLKATGGGFVDSDYSLSVGVLYAAHEALTFSVQEIEAMDCISIGSIPVGSMMNSYYTTPIVVLAEEKVMNADIVRRNLRMHYGRITNIELKDFIDLVNDNVAVKLSEWGLSAWADLTEGQKRLVRLYFSYWIGEMILLEDNNEKLQAKIKILKRQAYRQLVPLSSGSREYELTRISNTDP